MKALLFASLVGLFISSCPCSAVETAAEQVARVAAESSAQRLAAETQRIAAERAEHVAADAGDIRAYSPKSHYPTNTNSRILGRIVSFILIIMVISIITRISKWTSGAFKKNTIFSRAPIPMASTSTPNTKAGSQQYTNMKAAKNMKKAEVITLLCGLFGVAGIVLYLSFSSRLARAENESRKARDLVATMQQNETNRAAAQTAPTWQPPATARPVIETVDRAAAQTAPTWPPPASARPVIKAVEVPRIAVPPPVRLEHLSTDFRPISGTLILNRFAKQNVHKGSGKLTITNGLMEDTFVKVVEGSRLMAAMYVRGNSSYALDEVPDGVYTILYRKGFGWMADKRDFERGRGASRFENDLVYATRVQQEGNTIRTFYDSITLTLHKVVDGNAPAEDISEEEFNKYQ